LIDCLPKKSNREQKVPREPSTKIFLEADWSYIGISDCLIGSLIGYEPEGE
jgi:hypothetical protein